LTTSIPFAQRVAMDASPRPSVEDRFAGFPGWDLVRAGLRDLAADRDSIEAALVRSASEGLARIGIDLPDSAAATSGAELYPLVALEVGDARAHARYNALRRRLSSFLRAARHAPPG
jgi:hypothetical protein